MRAQTTTSARRSLFQSHAFPLIIDTALPDYSKAWAEVSVGKMQRAPNRFTACMCLATVLCIGVLSSPTVYRALPPPPPA